MCVHRSIISLQPSMMLILFVSLCNYCQPASIFSLPQPSVDVDPMCVPWNSYCLNEMHYMYFVECDYAYTWLHLKGGGGGGGHYPS